MIETYGPERQQELASEAQPNLPDSGRYRTDDDTDDIEAAVSEDGVEIYNVYGMALRTEPVGQFVMRVGMGVYERVGEGRHV